MHQAIPPPPFPSDGDADVRGDDGQQLVQPQEESPLPTLHMFNPAPTFGTGWPHLFPDANDERDSLYLRLLRRVTIGGPGNSALLSHNSLCMRKIATLSRRIPAQTANHLASIFIPLYGHRAITKVSQQCHKQGRRLGHRETQAIEERQRDLWIRGMKDLEQPNPAAPSPFA